MMTQGASHTNPKKRPLPRSSNSTFARGRDATSEDIARLIAGTDDDGVPLVFVVGGPYGHGDAVRQRGDDCLRLSRLVLNHQLAYVVPGEIAAAVTATM